MDVWVLCLNYDKQGGRAGRIEGVFIQMVIYLSGRVE